MGNDRSKELGAQIAASIEQWNRLKENGCSDPFWSDGVNMNLVRNHVIFYKKSCEKELAEGDYPPEYSLKTPPEVSNDYMARPDEIRKNAKKALKVYEKDPDYLWLKETASGMNEKQKKETGIMNVVDYPEALSFFIKTDRLVDMRRHENPEKYRESFRRCRSRVESYMAEKVVATIAEQEQEGELPMGQLSIFDLGYM